MMREVLTGTSIKNGLVGDLTYECRQCISVDRKWSGAKVWGSGIGWTARALTITHIEGAGTYIRGIDRFFALRGGASVDNRRPQSKKLIEEPVLADSREFENRYLTKVSTLRAPLNRAQSEESLVCAARRGHQEESRE